MSKNYSLKDFQNQLTSRLHNASTQPVNASRLGFRVAGYNWLVNLADIDEVLPVPAILPVPGARRWFRGAANIRGNLYAVSDLGDFLFAKPTPDVTSNRLLLAHYKLGVNAALIVEQTLGLKNLSQLTRGKRASEWPFATQHFRDGEGMDWIEIHLATLLGDPHFMAAEAPN
ncbi:MAG TPA: chemotaxis protein CheW [Thiobacillaceae bacterium]|nr:chemotaxis protein CheW [Thiobacillaceae bacterium]